MTGPRRLQPEHGLRDWARFNGLSASTRQARCLHGLLGMYGPCDDPQCKRKHLVDRPTLWNRDGAPVLLMVRVFAPTDFKTDEPGQVREWWEADVYGYAARFGVGVWIGRPSHPLAFGDRDRYTPVLYGRGVDPRDFTRISDHDPGVRRHRRRPPRPDTTIHTHRKASR